MPREIPRTDNKRPWLQSCSPLAHVCQTCLKEISSQKLWGRQMKQNTPLKINMEHNRGGLEDHVPF